ncbi:MAG: beta-N-acetylglucosaminidase domain-containing protein [Erysipelotrichales bacterium]|nr:beta-N-acetylglucosaminidase domain-containing protein [Erysipelotrichales bacterium]
MKISSLKKLMFIPLIVGMLSRNNVILKENDRMRANAETDVEVSKVEYEIYPTPQEIVYSDGIISLTKRVNVYAESSIDVYTKNKLYDILSLKDVKAHNVSKITDNGNFNINIGVYKSSEDVDKLCRGVDLSYIENKIDAYYLEINSNSIIVLGKDTDAVFYGLATLKMIFEQSKKQIRTLVIKDYSNSKWRGFIEGYYGIPWTSEERIELMRFGEIVKSNIYIYAPKDDSYHSSNWRGLYNERDLEVLKEQIQAGLETKTKFAWAIHPFMEKPITQSNYSEGLQAIINKFDQVYNAGVRQFVVSADDISVPEDGSTLTGYLHRDLLNDLAKWNKAKGDCGDLIFVPTAYFYVEHSTHLTNYLRTLVENLDSSISIMWTGNKVCSSVANGKFQEFKEITGREPFMWMNWPVNDYSTNHLLMGKGEVLNDNYLDKELDFSGIVTNPMAEAEPSKLSIFAICDYTWNIHQFDMDKSYLASFKYVEKDTPESLYEICQHLTNAGRFEDQYFEEAKELATLINNYNNAIKNGSNVERRIDALNTYFDKLIGCCDDFLNNGYNKKLIKAMRGWVEMISDMAIATKAYLEMAKNVDSYSDSEMLAKLNEADSYYDRAFTHTSPVLIRGSVESQIVDGGMTVLQPFLKSIRTSIRDDIMLKLGIPTGIVYEGFPNGIYEGAINNIMDGDDSTFCWFNGRPESGAYIRIDLEEVKEIFSIRILSGNAQGKDFMNGYVEYSNDAKTWTQISAFNGAQTIIDIRSNPIQARFIRLLDNNTSTWISIKEVSINDLNMDAFNAVEYDGFNGGIQEGTVDYIIDDDENTYCWFGKSTPDAYVKVDLGEVKTVESVQVLLGKPEGGDIMNGVVEYSLDGLTFIQIGELVGAKTIVDLRDAPVQARYIRIKNRSTANWVAVRDISVNKVSDDEPIVSSSGLTFVSQKKSSVSGINDGDLSTYAWYDWKGEAGSYVQIDLRKETEIKNIVFYQSCDDVPADYFRDFSIKYSLDGINWYTVGEEHYLADSNTNLELNLDLSNSPINARYVRVVTNIYMTNGVTIREFNVNINF